MSDEPYPDWAFDDMNVALDAAVARAEAAEARERKLVEALEAHHAWSYAEHHSLGSFDARCVLCAHAESLTARALAAIRGGAAPDYKGRRSLTVWPAVEIIESDEASARALVAEVLEHERAALSPYTPPRPRCRRTATRRRDEHGGRKRSSAELSWNGEMLPRVWLTHRGDGNDVPPRQVSLRQVRIRCRR